MALARPWISLQAPASHTSPWSSKVAQRRAGLIFAQPVKAHPAVVAETIHKHSPSSPSVCFTGQTNAGKSSLLNALVQREVARSCSTRGRTRHLFNFELGNKLALVDLPGFGQNWHIQQKLRDSWDTLLSTYFRTQKDLRACVCLVDARFGIRPYDWNFWEHLSHRLGAPPKLLVLTKVDLLSDEELHQQMATVCTRLSQVAGGSQGFLPYVHAVSSTEMRGIDELRAHVAHLTS